MSSYLRASLGTAFLFAALGLSRHVDAFVRVFLRQQTGESLITAMARKRRLGEATGGVLTMMGFGLSLWLALSLLLFWLSGRPLGELLGRVGSSMVPLLLPVALTLLACLSLIISPQFPYGVNLALTLAYQGSFAPLLAWSSFGLSLLLTISNVIQPREVFDFLASARWAGGLGGGGVGGHAGR